VVHAGIAAHPVRTQAADQGVGAAAADQAVVASIAFQPVMATRTESGVVAVPAMDDVIPAIAVDDVVAVAVAAEDGVGAALVRQARRIADQTVVAVIPMERVAAIADPDPVGRPEIAIDRIRTSAATQQIGASRAGRMIQPVGVTQSRSAPLPPSSVSPAKSTSKERSGQPGENQKSPVSRSLPSPPNRQSAAPELLSLA
jgi:hypothetical protein